MRKNPRLWQKFHCLPLRLLLLALCAWAVYVISTGLISPSSTPTTTTFPRQQSRSWQVFQNRSTAVSGIRFTPYIEKRFRQDAKNKVVGERQRLRLPSTNAQTLNNHSRVSDTLNNKQSPLFNEYFSKQEIKVTRGILPPIRRRWRSRDRLPEDSSGDVSAGTLIQRQNTENSLFERGNKFNELANNTLILGTRHKASTSQREQNIYLRKKPNLKFKTEKNGTNSNQIETFLRENTDVILSRSELISHRARKHIDKYGFNYALPSKQGHAQILGSPERPFVMSHTSHISDLFKDVKTILLWTLLYNGWNFLPVGSAVFSNCSEVRCEVTSNRNRLKDSHAVIFHVRTMSLLDLPPFRLPHQKWIFFSLEPPTHSYFPGFHFMQGMFNWTMTYRRDSDIVIPYGRAVQLYQSSPQNNTKSGKDWESLWKTKTRPVIWMVSHCDTYSKREFYVHQLQEFIDVDVLGGCGTAVCLFNETYKCLEAFSRRYKFFLAFENSICDDYITEKFFRALKYDIVPVVLGGADYRTVAPPGSYINAADFSSPETLADYLHLVSENITLYRTYLDWKNGGGFDIQDTPSHCSICQKLHSSDFKDSSTYTNIAKWWIDDSHCTKWSLK